MSESVTSIKDVLKEPEKYPETMVNAALGAVVFHNPKKKESNESASRDLHPGSD